MMTPLLIGFFTQLLNLQQPGHGATASGAATSKPATATTTGAAKPTPTSADAVVGEVQAFYARINRVTAKFKQTVTNAAFGDTNTSTGMVWISKPGKMRWDYYGKAAKGATPTVRRSFISNGKTLWVIDHDNKMVNEKNLESDLLPVAVTFLYGKGDLRTEFSAAIDASKKYGTATDIVLRLTPKKPTAQYKALYLVVAKDNYRVRESIIIDSSDNVNQFAFYEPNFEKAVKSTWFEFDAASVKGYRVSRGDEAGGL